MVDLWGSVCFCDCDFLCCGGCGWIFLPFHDASSFLGSFGAKWFETCWRALNRCKSKTSSRFFPVTFLGVLFVTLSGVKSSDLHLGDQSGSRLEEAGPIYPFDK